MMIRIRGVQAIVSMGPTMMVVSEGYTVMMIRTEADGYGVMMNCTRRVCDDDELY